MNKRVCRFCQTNQYGEKYAEHLKQKHPNALKAREIIKNTTRFMEEKELWKVVEFLNETKKKEKME